MSSGINSPTGARNASRLTATSSEHLTLAFVKRALTPKATWTHKVTTSLLSSRNNRKKSSFSCIIGRISRCSLLASTSTEYYSRNHPWNFIRERFCGHYHVRISSRSNDRKTTDE